MMIVKSTLVCCASAVFLAGCQTIYPTHYVPSSPLSVEYKSDSYDFRVIDLTPSAALEANKVWPYSPRSIPLGLQSDIEQKNVTVRATSFGEATPVDDTYLIAQVSQSVPSVRSSSDLRSPPQSPAKPYRVGVGDVFTVTIDSFNNTSGTAAFQSTTTVDYAGNIFLTDVGEVNVLGRTVNEARQIVANSFRDARLSSNASATVTEFNSQKALVSVPGSPTSFLPITNKPITLRDAYLRYSSGIDRDAERQVVVLRRNGTSYSTRGLDVLRQAYDYEVFLQDKDEIQIFDTLLNDYETAAVSDEVLALRRAEAEKNQARRDEERFRLQQEQFSSGELRADRQDQRAEQQLEIARENAIRAEQQLEIARLNAQISQSAEARAEANQARLDAQEARAAAAESRAARQLALGELDNLRAEANQARLDAQEARAAAAESRVARQSALEELGNLRAERQLELAEENAKRLDRGAELTKQNTTRDLARARLDLGLAEQDRIFVGGEVGQQQTVPMPFDRQFTLAEAIYGSRGIEPVSGDPSRIYVVRVKSTVADHVESYIFHFDGGNLANTATMTMFQMRPNDYVLVMPRRITNWSRFVSQLVPTLNSALTAARTASF